MTGIYFCKECDAPYEYRKDRWPHLKEYSRVGMCTACQRIAIRLILEIEAMAQQLKGD